MARKSGLGKGLDALIPGGQVPAGNLETEGVHAPAGQGVQEIPIQSILPNPHQPRTNVDPEELKELADSIRAHGVIQPLLVTRGEGLDQFILIAGERRLLACRLAGLEQVPAIVREASEQERVELALVENVKRADLTPLETAEAYRQLAELFGLAHEQIAARVGKSRAAVTNTLRLLKLPENVRKALADGSISEGHARSLLALSSSQAQKAVLQTILKNELNVRQTEELVRKYSGQKPTRPPKAALPPELTELEDRLRTRLGTRISLHPMRKGGTLVIHYYSDEELNALVEQLLNLDR